MGEYFERSLSFSVTQNHKVYANCTALYHNSALSHDSFLKILKCGYLHFNHLKTNSLYSQETGMLIGFVSKQDFV